MFCKACGKQLDDAAAFCSSCGNAVSTEHPKNGSLGATVKRFLLVLATAFIVLMVVAYFVGAGHIESYRKEHPVERCSPEDEDAGKAGFAVLSAWEHGQSSALYWVGFIEKRRLFAVKEATLPLSCGWIFDRKTGAKKGTGCTFRVQSSTQGGFSITKDWTFLVQENAGKCRVADVWEAQ